jgi:hypothetical protein
MAFTTGKKVNYDPFAEEKHEGNDFTLGDPVDYDPFKEEEKEKGTIAKIYDWATGGYKPGEPRGAGADYMERQKIRDEQQPPVEQPQAQQPIVKQEPLPQAPAPKSERSKTDGNEGNKEIC